jgi:hypothetical protein
MDHIHALSHHSMTFQGRLLGRKVLEGHLGHAVQIGVLPLEPHPIFCDTLLHSEESDKMGYSDQSKYITWDRTVPQINDDTRVDRRTNLAITERVTVNLGVPRALYRRRMRDEDIA